MIRLRRLMRRSQRVNRLVTSGITQGSWDLLSLSVPKGDSGVQSHLISELDLLQWETELEVFCSAFQHELPPDPVRMH